VLNRLDETIAAISSAPGRGRLGIVRLSGPQALAIVNRIARVNSGAALADLPGSTRVRGEVVLDPNQTFPADFYVFRAPHSYTLQDLVEIHTIGSPPVLEIIRRAAFAHGAVSAEPGEFTARAFLNGAMDLAAAEGVAAVIRAQSDTQLRAARRMMGGAVAEPIRQARDELAELVALIEADIDFAEEPIEFITPAELRDRLEDISRRLNQLVSASPVVERFDSLPRILLLGRPNVGKSSLMNRLSGTSRAICAAVAGTTRDLLSAPIRLGRGEAILLDAAGIDHSTDAVLAQAQAGALFAAEQVDAVCFVVDATCPGNDSLPSPAAPLPSSRTVIALNKCDLVTSAARDRMVEHFEARGLGHVRAVSAIEGMGVELLRAAMAEALADAASTTLGEAILLSERQRRTTIEALQAIGRAADLSATARGTIDCADLLAFELREALEALGSVTGDVTTDDLLGRVFARFCIGK